MIDFSIIIPVYNGAEYMSKNVRALIKYCDAQKYNYEILMCDDHSTDGSRQIMCDFTQEFENVRIRFNEENNGLGNTLRRMIPDAKGEVVIYLDADLPFGEDVVGALIEKMDQYDIVVASRYAGVPNQVKPLRKGISRLYYGLAKILFQVPVKDIGSGSVAMNKEVIRAISLRSDGFDIHLELYVKAMKHKFRIFEMPIESKGIHTSSFRILQNAPVLLFGLLALWIKSITGGLKRG